MDTLITIIIFVFSIVVHEVAHAYSAYLFGDTTAKDEGRITLNPIPHIDLWWTILLPAFLFFSTQGKFIFGGAKPVPINPLRFSNRRLGISLVSAAGPLSNISLALISAFFLNIFIYFGVNIPLLNIILFKGVLFNMVLAGFNLIPIPPLDGSKLLVYFLPPEYEYNVMRMEMFGFILLIVAINFGLFSFVVNHFILPIINYLIPLYF
ncbi:MAG TPA: site-2 protease family protein [bacterium]|nr:site-2 protease family protein [bacterium]